MSAKEKKGDDWVMIYGVAMSFVGGTGLLILKILDNLHIGVDGILRGFSVSATAIGTLMIVFSLLHANKTQRSDD